MTKPGNVGATESARIEMLDAHRAAVSGVAEVIRALHDIPEDIRYLKDRIVGSLLWVVTEFKPGIKHKVHGVRWRTPAAHALVTAKDTKRVRHEHVIERRWMIDFLHEHHHVIDVALWNYPACLVTVEEHALLGGTFQWGWFRYTTAGLTVLDGESGTELNLVEADRQLRELYRGLGADL